MRSTNVFVIAGVELVRTASAWLLKGSCHVEGSRRKRCRRSWCCQPWEGSHRKARRLPCDELFLYLVADILDCIANLATRFAESLFDLTGGFVRCAFIAESVIVS